jgi:8-oxo-dGTP pyrophosphatase MutT (NUDIX family)
MTAILPDPTSADTETPRDAATLIIVDRTAGEARVLMGRRHPKQIFLPDKFVFPGGRSESFDEIVPSVSDLRDSDIAKLLYDMKGPASAGRARALALAALRETYEETGILVGENHVEANSGDLPLPANIAPAWRDFFSKGVRPALAPLTFLARAITPPGRPRRYDTRFFWVDASRIALRAAPKDDELRDLDWFTIDEIRRLDIPNITRAVVEDLSEHLSAGPDTRARWPVPFYFFASGTFERMLVR